jgi:hypothetical protein
MPLDKILRPRYSFDLVRIGKNNDGGYLVGTNSLERSRYLISLGIGDDWSFEEDFLKKNRSNVIVKCFDDILDEKFLIKRIILQLLPIFYNRNFKYFMYLLKNYFNFLKIKKKIKFNKKKIFYNDLNEILNKISGEGEGRSVFLKIDIEGSEYRILDSILSNQNKLLGLVIEFHDCDLHKDRILNFVKNLNLTLIHIHGNNYAETDLGGDVTVFEVTFDKFPIKIDEVNKLPNLLDMPNDANQKEIILKFDI